MKIGIIKEKMTKNGISLVCEYDNTEIKSLSVRKTDLVDFLC
jgi:hypothetical protein